MNQQPEREDSLAAKANAAFEKAAVDVVERARADWHARNHLAGR